MIRVIIDGQQSDITLPGTPVDIDGLQLEVWPPSLVPAVLQRHQEEREGRFSSMRHRMERYVKGKKELPSSGQAELCQQTPPGLPHGE